MPIEEEWDLAVGDHGLKVLVRRPEGAAAGRGFLVNLALDRRTTLGTSPYRTVSDRLLQSGWTVASFDLPFHGGEAPPGVEPLTAMARAVERGEDPFAAVVDRGRAVVDAAIERGHAAPGQVAVAGTSRGGLSALHVLAADPRVWAAAVFAPVTRLAALREFAALEARPLVPRRSAASLVAALAGRPLYVSINAADPRVDTGSCLDFVAAARRAWPAARVSLDVFALSGHGTGELGYVRGATFLLGVTHEALEV